MNRLPFLCAVAALATAGPAGAATVGTTASVEVRSGIAVRAEPAHAQPRIAVGDTVTRREVRRPCRPEPARPEICRFLLVELQ
jgi:hypothetical protein